MRGITGWVDHGPDVSARADVQPWVRQTERRLDAHALPGGWAALMAR
ncbi:MAG: hypothetical protein ACREQ5_05915 [Candidatus Dormibacteria bacterium]